MSKAEIPRIPPGSEPGSASWHGTAWEAGGWAGGGSRYLCPFGSGGSDSLCLPLHRQLGQIRSGQGPSQPAPQRSAAGGTGSPGPGQGFIQTQQNHISLGPSYPAGADKSSVTCSGSQNL